MVEEGVAGVEGGEDGAFGLVAFGGVDLSGVGGAGDFSDRRRRGGC